MSGRIGGCNVEASQSVTRETIEATSAAKDSVFVMGVFIGLDTLCNDTESAGECSQDNTQEVKTRQEVGGNQMLLNNALMRLCRQGRDDRR